MILKPRPMGFCKPLYNLNIITLDVMSILIYPLGPGLTKWRVSQKPLNCKFDGSTSSPVEDKKPRKQQMSWLNLLDHGLEVRMNQELIRYPDFCTTMD